MTSLVHLAKANLSNHRQLLDSSSGLMLEITMSYTHIGSGHPPGAYSCTSMIVPAMLFQLQHGKKRQADPFAKDRSIAMGKS